MPKYDYSEYQMSDIEKRAASRRGNKSVKYAYFDNEVHFDADDRIFTLLVDPSREDWYMQEDIDEYNENERKRRYIREDTPSQEDIDEEEQNRIDGLAENEKILNKLHNKYSIFSTQYHTFETSYYDDNPSVKQHPHHNVLSGVGILLKYGEGILDFVYADFETPAKALLRWRSAFDAMLFKRNGEETQPERKEFVEKIYDRNQIIVEDYFKYTSTMSMIKDIAYASIYSAICPPIFQDFHSEVKGIKSYYAYLRSLQEEYLDMLEFCFDEEFYPEVLGGNSPSERYYIYKRLHNRGTIATRKQLATFRTTSFNGIVAPEGVMPKDLIKRLTTEIPMTDKHREFAEKYSYDLESLERELRYPHVMQLHYEFHTVEEILEMEFTTMLKEDVRFRKCKRCGKYFIMKGNYDTNYCDRVAEGQTRSCQDLAAQENYKAKAAENPALPIYSKYYKRYAARVRSRQIKEADFKKWKFQALTKRDECTDGKITVDEFVEWLEASFPNRKPKE